MNIKKYIPEDFQYEVKDDLKKIYQILESNNHKDLYAAVENLHIDIKDAVKFGEIDPIDGREMQIYFWEMVR